MYWRLRYAAAPSWIARAISRMRSFPSGWRTSQAVRKIPYAIATPEQTSANSTAWSLKKLPTISVPTPSQGQRRVVPGAGRFLSHAAGRRPARQAGGALGVFALRPRGVGVGELEVRRHLPEVPEDVLPDRALQNGDECPHRLDREPRLVEIAVLLGQPAVAERRDRVERLHEQVGNLELLQLLLELTHQLLVVLGHAGSQSSKRFPSGSTAQPKRPNSISCTCSSTSTPASRSCSSIASRSRTR